VLGNETYLPEDLDWNRFYLVWMGFYLFPHGDSTLNPEINLPR
jgi:hypothetical protein